MEGGSCCLEQKALIGELIQGMELANQLRQNLSSNASPESREFLAQKILSSYEKALLILNWGGSEARRLGLVAGLSVPGSPISAATESPRSDDQDSRRDGSRKRKALPRWTDQVRVSSENNGLEGPQDDGYNWRKYGQKDILGAKYPRSYYRCTFRNTQNCWATKQVQRSDEDPYLFDITYRGSHACSQAGNTVQPPTSPENDNRTEFGNSGPHIPKNLRVVTEDLTSSFSFPNGFNGHWGLENEAFLGSFSRQFMSPATPESSYFPVSPFQVENSTGFRCSESDLTEIVSANTSATNSPIPELDFSLDRIEFDPNFPFDTTGFFS